jgi:uncharacterized OB-fold protein
VSTNLARPLPTPTEWDRGYWDAARENRLVVQVCADCNEVRSFPRLGCPSCGSLDFSWLPAAGTGTLFSWSVLRRCFHPGFTELPLIVAIVELDDFPDVHLVANLRGVPDEVLEDPAACIEALPLGARVSVEFESLGEVTLPQFRLA